MPAAARRRVPAAPAAPAHPHEGGEGLKLAANAAESVVDVPGCARGAPVRRYDVAAIAVDITLNRYLDHDPQGRMYVLESRLASVRDEEARNARARTAGDEPAVTLGLQGDAIQPLTLRVRPGECLQVRLRNALPGREPASFHLHDSGLRVAGGGAATVRNPGATVAPGGRATYEWMVPSGAQEGTRYVHSHGRPRSQSGHGLFGAVVVEPPGSRWLDPLTGRAADGWHAMIVDANGPDFREYVLLYHEIGPESFQLTDRDGNLVPIVDTLTSAYRPGSRAINYRAEPFMNRLRLQQQRTGRVDESLAYSSYAFGDPATPVARAYLGDPVKQRVVHAGPEVFHVHHVHGGSIRWRRQPAADDAGIASGLTKHPMLLPRASERIDSQALGPSEAFDVENECGAGGCQQSAGDYLFHCHVAHHYFAGMWGIWRVYNTRQNGAASTDALDPLFELPDRTDRVVPAVASPPDGADAQLPPQGEPKGYDASVWDWQRDGAQYLGEPETEHVWPGNRPTSPGTRPVLLFDAKTGRLAYPFLRPHLGRRPPFAPNHGPAPFLDPLSEDSRAPAPGANGPASVCPSGTTVKTFRIHAIALPIPLNRRLGLVDPHGQIFVLRGEEDEVRSQDRMKVPLTIRANAGEDCVDVILASELEDTGFSKVNLHVHFAQFDVQASDGVVNGFNYEQSVRPFRSEGERAVAPAAAGATSLRLVNAERFRAGSVVGIGMDEGSTFEIRRVRSASGGTLELDEPLEHAHRAGEIVSAEFVRYRWYPDVQFGTAYFHDHVNALASWRHGLYGALIAEPPGSRYRSPYTGAEIASGPVADVITDGRVSADVTGSFRELTLFLQDDNPLTQIGRSAGSAVNLRVEPLARRGSGDPETPVLEVYAGDPVVARVLVAGTNDVHTLHVDGHSFRVEPHSRTSPPVRTVHLGISERYDLSIPAAGGPDRRPGDYVWTNGRLFKMREGSWGLLRVHSPGAGGELRPLPGRDPPPAPGPVCPSGAPRHRFEVDAVSRRLPMLDGAPGRIFVRPGADAGSEPLVLHLPAGDCAEVTLANRTDRPVSFAADSLVSEPAPAVGPGETRTSTLYAHPELGEHVAIVRDTAGGAEGAASGLYGAIVVVPRGSEVRVRDATSAVVIPPRGRAYREFTLFLHDEDAGIGTHRMPYSDRVQGTVGLNYRKAPLAEGRDLRALAPTPLLEAVAGDDVRIHVLAPSSEQSHVFTVEGHDWPFEPGLRGTDRIAGAHVGGLEAVTLRVTAGGSALHPGQYVYGDHREPYREAGLWGVLRVSCPGDGVADLPGRGVAVPACADGPPALAGGAALFVGLSGAMLLMRRRRRATAPRWRPTEAL